MGDSTRDTLDHINKVQGKLLNVIVKLAERGLAHDASKLKSPEKETLDAKTARLFGLSYGSEDYMNALSEVDMAAFLSHHYANNSHHPEHYSDGINGMSLLDIIEMLADWKAAGERHENGNLADSIAFNIGRFKIDAQLADILTNTAKELGWL